MKSVKRVSMFACVLSLGLLGSGTLIADDISSGKVSDPAFEKYVDADLLDVAVRSPNAAMLTDVALQLAEGERVLLRSHRGISADDMLKLAARVAAAKGDEATQARLKMAAEKLGKGNLVAEFDSIAKLAGASRSVEKPKFSVGDDKDLALAVEGIVSAIDDAALLLNGAELKKIEQSVRQSSLPEKLAGELADYAAKANASPALAKLSGESRQFGSPTVSGATYNDPNRVSGPVTVSTRRDPNAESGNSVRYSTRRDPNAESGSSGPVDRSSYFDPNQNSGMGGGPFYSSKLRARFMVVPSGGRSINELFWGSPLQKAGIEVGDIIIRMDGTPVNSDWELDNHYGWTIIDIINWRTGGVVRTRVWIP